MYKYVFWPAPWPPSIASFALDIHSYLLLMRFVHKLISTNESPRQASHLGGIQDDAKHQTDERNNEDENKAQMKKKEVQHSEALRLDATAKGVSHKFGTPLTLAMDHSFVCWYKLPANALRKYEQLNVKRGKCN